MDKTPKNTPAYLHTMNYKFKYPRNMIRFKDEFYVVDTHDNCILVFSALKGTLERKINQTKNSTLYEPFDVVIHNDTLYVIEQTGIHMYNPFNGAYLDTITHRFFSPKSICVSPDKMFVSNMDTIDVFSLADHAHLYTITNEELCYIQHICYLDSNLYITDEDSQYVIIMHTESNTFRKMTHNNEMHVPHCVFATDNTLFVGDSYHTGIHAYDLRNNTLLYTLKNLI